MSTCQREGGGLTKRAYESRHHAQLAARATQPKVAKRMFVYRCRDCRLYHISSQRPML